jgi:hypothetical protein
MDISFHKVYLYDHVRQLLAVGDTFCSIKDNGPMSKTPIRVHKGIDNKVIFRALGPDRTPYKIACNQQVYARIIDPENRSITIEKLCTLGPAHGIITLELDAGDLAYVHAGLYDLVLIRTEEFVSNVPDYYIEKPLFSDFDNNVSMKLEITEQALKPLQPSHVVLPENWTPDIMVPTFGPPTPCFYTSRIPGARVLNHNGAVHSFSTYTTNFTGVLEIWATLEESPGPYLDDRRWFKIYPSSMSQDIQYIGYTGTQAWTFAANFMWIKFRYYPSQEVLDPGTMNKLIVRT